MKKLKIQWQGKEREVLVQKIKGKLWFHLDGETHSYSPEINQSSSGAAASQDPTKIVAPMPGKVMKVLKSVGDAVKTGETVVVLEAMKMEYNLKAEADFKVKKINAKEEQSVALGALLVELEE